MRTIIKELGGKRLTLKADFAASKLIADTVCDPLEIARESAAESYFIENGIPYQPRFKFSIKNVVQLLVIGSGEDQDKIEELVFEAGFITAKDLAVDYLGQIIGPGPADNTPEEGDAPTEKSSGSTS